MRKGLEHFVVLGPALKLEEIKLLRAGCRYISQNSGINFNEQRGRSCGGEFQGNYLLLVYQGIHQPATKVTIHPVEREEDVPHPLSIFWF